MQSEERDQGGDSRFVDQRIAKLVSDMSSGTNPQAVEARVLDKVRRRRRNLRAGYVLTAVIALAVLGLSSWARLGSEPSGNQLAQETNGMLQYTNALDELGLAEIESGFLAAPPPVVMLGVISNDQIAMLNCLESLAEESK